MTAPLRLAPREGETVEGFGRALRSGATTCAAALEHCFHQIDLWDEKVHAWVFIDRAGAMKRARALDEDLRGGRDHGPLHGVPIGVKDIVDVAGMPTAAGFGPWKDKVSDRDAALVTNLRDAGAVILGKTITTQFAWIDPPPTLNPWELTRTPGGSSSGSAVAVATGMCLASIGTQTGGSIIRPASFCGVYGYKPPFGAVSVEGVLPFAPSLDHSGVMARSVEGLRLVGQVISGTPIGARADDPPVLYRLRGSFEFLAHSAADRAMSEALTRFVEADAWLDDRGPSFDGVIDAHRVIMAREAAGVHAERFAAHPSAYRPMIRSLIEEGSACTDDDEWKARDLGRRFGEEITGRVFGTASVRGRGEAIVTPAATGQAPDTATTGDPVFNSPWSLTGAPVISIPVSLSPDGLPLAIQLVGRRDEVEELFAVALWCERTLRAAGREPEA